MNHPPPHAGQLASGEPNPQGQKHTSWATQQRFAAALQRPMPEPRQDGERPHHPWQRISRWQSTAESDDEIALITARNVSR
jgi:hypothetical protein